MKKLLLVIVISLLVTSSLVGCTNTNVKKEKESKIAKDDIVLNMENKDEISHYPVDIITYNYAGDEVVTTYEKAPEKVMAVYQSSIEIMLALGLEDKVIAAAGLDNPVKLEWEEAFNNLNYLDTFDPVKEDVIMMQPDLILCWGSLFNDKKLGDVDYWHKTNVNTYINTNTRGGSHSRILDNEYIDIINLGKIFDVEKKANEIVDKMKAEVANTADLTSKIESKQNVLVVEFYESNIYNYGGSTLAGDMVTQLGGNLMPVEGDLSKEGIIKLNPDIIFIIYMQREDSLKNAEIKYANMILNDPAFSSLASVESRRVFPIMLGETYASGIRSLDGISKFSQGMYPELNLVK